MFRILREALRPGTVTTKYPANPAEVSPRARGRPEIDWANLHDLDALATACPAGAFSVCGSNGQRELRFDLGRCNYCGLCADATPAIRMTNRCESATRSREALITRASYARKGESALRLVRPVTAGPTIGGPAPNGVVKPEATLGSDVLPALAADIQARAARRFGRSLHIREVDAGSCNGCEVEIGGLSGPVYDVERFGIHFVASPRHADLLLVTGPVTRNMELALRKTYAAMPTPRLVVAVGACGCSGGMFGQNYATCGAVDAVIPVDVYIPGCPPNPHALLQGILLAIDRWPANQG